MINLKRIETIAKIQEKTIGMVAKKAGLSASGLKNMIDTNNCSTTNLLKIADTLGVSALVFFDSEDVFNSVTELTKQQDKIFLDMFGAESLKAFSDRCYTEIVIPNRDSLSKTLTGEFMKDYSHKMDEQEKEDENVIFEKATKAFEDTLKQTDEYIKDYSPEVGRCGSGLSCFMSEASSVMNEHLIDLDTFMELHKARLAELEVTERSSLAVNFTDMLKEMVESFLGKNK